MSSANGSVRGDALREGALSIVRRLHGAGHRALWAGGCVRDVLLGRTPQDYDIATDADPQRVIGIFSGTTGTEARFVGEAFGVVLVRTGGQSYEVARFRTEGPYSDGRRPDHVTFADEREDALRRDFTVNGMFYDPVGDEVLDYVGGQEDLARRVVRTIGEPDARFDEDRLRMLRAIRFASRFLWDIDPVTFEAIVRHHRGIDQVSAERVRDEILRTLTEGGAPQGVRFMLDTGLMDAILPEVSRLGGVAQPPRFHPEGDVLTHTLLMLGLMRDPSPELALGVLLHDVGKPDTYEVADRIRFHNHTRVGAEIAESVCARLRLSSEQTDHVVRLVADHHLFVHVHEMRPARLKRLLRSDRFEDHLELHRLDCTASHGKLENYDFCRRALADLGPEEIRPKPLVTGHDLIALGYAPGPPFAVALEAVEDGQLEGAVGTREDALALARSVLAREGALRRTQATG